MRKEWVCGEKREVENQKDQAVLSAIVGEGERGETRSGGGS